MSKVINKIRFKTIHETMQKEKTKAISSVINKAINKAVLERVKPDQKEKETFNRVTAEFLERLNFKLKNAQAILGGSGAKGTWLSGNHDIDVFILFDYKKYADKSLELSDLFEPWLKKVFPQEKILRVHGSRDYFQFSFQGYDFEVIPILKISKSKDALNITDISPLHIVWVNQQPVKVKDEIMIAKQFFKANNLYGAESYLAGFSGYVLEILVSYYGSFNHLLQAAQKWKLKEVVDPEKHYPQKDALFHLNKSKVQSPLIVLDPVDKNRNAAAALSEEKFFLLKKIAFDYLKKPNEKYFEKVKVDYELLKKNVEAHQQKIASKKKQKNEPRSQQVLIFMKIQPLQGKEDVIGMKLLKAFEFLKESLYPFELKDAGWEWDKQAVALFYFIVQKTERLPVQTILGPPLELTEFVKEFQKKHPNTFNEKGRIVTQIKIKNFKLKDFLQEQIHRQYFKERVKEVKEIKIQ